LNLSRTADCYKHVHSGIIKNHLFLCMDFNDNAIRGIILIIIIIIIIFINCNWVITRWQWVFYMYTNIKKK
jgi:hypothetical protein